MLSKGTPMSFGRSSKNTNKKEKIAPDAIQNVRFWENGQ